MRLHDNSLALLIMEHLNSSGGIPRKNLYTPFVGYVYRYYARVVKSLIDEGYLEVYRFNRINHVKLTDAGRGALITKKEEDAEVIKKNKAKPKNAKDKKRLALMSGVIGLCKANYFLVEETEKPKLEDLFINSDNPLFKERSDAFEQAVENGVFYTTRELRRSHMDIFGKNEIANWSRLAGILFFKKEVSYVYSINRTLIKWVEISERRTVETTTEFLLKSPIISNGVIFYNKPACIVCGQGMSMIPKLVIGRRFGKLDERATASAKYKSMLARDSINSHNLRKVFSAAYYVSVDSSGANMFKIVAALNDDKRELIAQDGFSKMNEVYRLKTLMYYQGKSSKSEIVIHAPYIDLIQLLIYREQGEPCHLVISKGYQEAIARVMGGLVLSIRDLSGNILKHGTYDRNGGKVE